MAEQMQHSCACHSSQLLSVSCLIIMAGSWSTLGHGCCWSLFLSLFLFPFPYIFSFFFFLSLLLPSSHFPFLCLFPFDVCFFFSVFFASSEAQNMLGYSQESGKPVYSCHGSSCTGLVRNTLTPGPVQSGFPHTASLPLTSETFSL